MSTQTARSPFPRGALIGAGGVIVLSIMAAAAGRIVGPAGMPPAAQAVVSRDVRFADTAEGAVNVYSGSNAAPVDVIAPTTDSFLRATMRTLARERYRESVGSDVPFRLTEWNDGRLTLDDPATGRHIELEAFGGTNEAVFARVLAAAAKVP